ncbi:hypothetical protein [Phaffia rhodozyma]|uniref:Uncharacterized protein n=1 Tax=Phaffia rhodozyma TaxID=264483 RepID=A0A0F7SI09_PHARH|nr:hypothetical protein [Phaffia rhodozyma]
MFSKSNQNVPATVDNILEQIPAFNLLVVDPSSTFTTDTLPVLLQSVFGINDLHISPQSDIAAFVKSPTNIRITISSTTSTAKASQYIHSNSNLPLGQRVHAVWFFSPPDLFESEMKLLAQDLKLITVPTLVLVAASDSDFRNWSIALRHQGVERPLLNINTSDPSSLAVLSKRTETALVDKPELRLLWVAAQRISRDEKINTSIVKGMKLFLVAVGASAQPIPFVGGATGVTALGLLQRDIVDIYNFQDPGRVLFGKLLGNLFFEVATALPVKWLVSAVGLSTISGLWESSASARSIMMAIADLVLVLDALLLHTQYLSPTSKKITAEEVQKIIKRYEQGPPTIGSGLIPSFLPGSKRLVDQPGSGSPLFSRSLVHQALGKDNIGTFNVWKSFQRQEAQKFLTEVIEKHRFRG